MNQSIINMKQLSIILTFLLLSTGLYSQTPNMVSYQAVVKNGGSLLTNQSIGIKVSILQGSMSGTSVYEETHSTTTNANGLLSINVGGGMSTDDFSTIDWSSNTYFIKTEIDPSGGTAYAITGVSQLLSVPYALRAKTAGKTYKVGDFAQGGVVFWVDETGKHGLVCAKEDQGTARWHGGTIGNTWTFGDGVYAGKTNTAIIISTQTALGADGDTYAARVCNELQVTEAGVTYANWYLPSRNELALMYQNRAAINTTALSNGGTIFNPSSIIPLYWSSTEFVSSNTFVVNFDTGSSVTSVFKSNELLVRAIRAF